MPTIRPISSTQSVYETAETSGEFSEANWLSDNIPRRHTDITSGQGSAITNYPTDLSVIRVLGANGQSQEAKLTPTQELEFLGFHLCSVTMTLTIPSEKFRKIQQDAWINQ